MTTVYLLAAIIALGGGVAVLVMLIQRNSARVDRDAALKQAAELQLVVAAHADAEKRKDIVVGDLQARLSQITKELDAYASKDPALAGDRLAGVLSQPPGVPSSPDQLPAQPAPAGTTDPGSKVGS